MPASTLARIWASPWAAGRSVPPNPPSWGESGSNASRPDVKSKAVVMPLFRKSSAPCTVSQYRSSAVAWLL
jgi:hypothetical protein